MRRLIIASIILGLVVLAQTQGVVILNRGCKQFNAAGNCLSCATRYYKDEEGICQPVNTNCNTYNPVNGACTSCYSGFVQIEDTCLPEALFPNIAPVTDPYCNRFEGAKCIKCAFGYFFDVNGKCKQADPNCRLFNETIRQCQGCYPGFMLKDKNCVVEPPGGVLENCNEIKDGICVKCSFGYYFGINRKCKKIPDTCLNFDTGAEKCLACYSGYTLNNNSECIKSAAEKTDPGCNTFENGICVRCSFGYYFDSSNRCRQIPSTCGDFDTALGICRRCYPGYQLNGSGRCIAVEAGAGDSGCSEFSDGNCVKCSFGFYFNDLGLCTQIPPTCANFDTISQVCLQCYPGFSLNKQNICQQSDAADGCNLYEQGVCVKCSFGFYFNPRNICAQIPPTCSNFDEVNQICRGCYSGYTLDVNNRCVQEKAGAIDPGCAQFQNGICIKCSFGFYFGRSGQCRLIPPTCSNFDTGLELCRACYPGYQLNKDKVCVESAAGEVDPGCTEFKDGRCVRCSFGFYFGKSGKCRLIPPTCSSFDTTNQICNACYPGYALNSFRECIEAEPQAGDAGCNEFQNGVCVKCSFGFYFGPQGNCKLIPPTCSNYDTGLEICRACYSGYELDQNNICVESELEASDPGCNEFRDGVCVKCSFGYYFGPLGRCKLSPPTCTDFDTSLEICRACYPGYELNSNFLCIRENLKDGDAGCTQFKNGKCVKCSFGFYFGPQGNCKLIPPTCTKYDTKLQICNACYPGYALDKSNICVQSAPEAGDSGCNQFKNGKCVKCSFGFYFGPAGNCKIVPPTCNSFNTRTERCQTCYPGYGLNLSGVCVKQDQADIDPYCREFKGNQCVACSEGAYFNQKKICVLSDPSCKTFNVATSRCIECYIGYTVQNGKCVKSTAETGDAFCKRFVDNVCVQCSFRYFQNDKGKCTEVNPSCKDYIPSTGRCTTCYIGFKLEGNNCVEDQDVLTDSNCAQWKDGVCLRCSTGSYFDQSTRLCRLVNPLCKTYNQSNGFCLTCYPAFKLEQGKCIEDLYFEDQDPNCAEFIDGLCVRCSSRFYFGNQGLCQQVNPLCDNYDERNGRCLSCFLGFALSNNGLCEEDEGQLTDFNCAQFSNGICLRCSIGFFFNNQGICRASNPLCKSFNQKNGDCTECYVGFYLDAGTCLVDENLELGDSLCAEWSDGICLRCASRAFFNNQGQCEAVSVDCRTFDIFDGSCSSCYPGFKIDGRDCVRAPEGEGEGCAEFDKNGLCLKCAVRRYLDNGQCKQIDDLCAEFDYRAKECIGCYSGYSILNKKCEITKVDEGKEIQNCFAYTPQGACLECFDRFYVKKNMCEQVSVFCKKYSKINGDCTQCYTGFRLQKGECVRG